MRTVKRNITFPKVLKFREQICFSLPLSFGFYSNSRQNLLCLDTSQETLTFGKLKLGKFSQQPTRDCSVTTEQDCGSTERFTHQYFVPVMTLGRSHFKLHPTSHSMKSNSAAQVYIIVWKSLQLVNLDLIRALM